MYVLVFFFILSAESVTEVQLKRADRTRVLLVPCLVCTSRCVRRRTRGNDEEQRGTEAKEDARQGETTSFTHKRRSEGGNMGETGALRAPGAHMSVNRRIGSPVSVSSGVGERQAAAGQREREDDDDDVRAYPLRRRT